MIVIKQKTKRNLNISGNRGMELESSINDSNSFYNEKKISYIYKKPTPIKVVTLNGKVITKAFFEGDSTLDYCGIYCKKFIEFEAKSTKSKTSFPLKNIAEHQLNHLLLINKLGGISFLIIEFAALNEYYLLSCSILENFILNSRHKSIKIDFFIKNAIKIKQGYHPRLYYLEALDSLL